MGLLTPHQADVLKSLAEVERQVPGRYWRPRDIGAFRGSHHARTLGTLLEEGLVERRALDSGVTRQRPTFEYRISSEGLGQLNVLALVRQIPAESVPGRSVDVARTRLAQRLAPA